MQEQRDTLEKTHDAENERLFLIAFQCSYQHDSQADGRTDDGEKFNYQIISIS